AQAIFIEQLVVVGHEQFEIGVGSDRGIHQFAVGRAGGIMAGCPIDDAVVAVDDSSWIGLVAIWGLRDPIIQSVLCHPKAISAVGATGLSIPKAGHENL